MKKKIPLLILEALQPYINNKHDLVKIDISDDTIIQLIDKDNNSDFYFKIIKSIDSGDSINYLIDFKPESDMNTNPCQYRCTFDGTIGYMHRWIEILEAYNKMSTISDDPILKSNQERFEKQFEILEEDADISSFDLNQQIYLNEYLNNIKTNLNTLKEGRPENEVKQIEELAIEATEIQNNLTKETKKQIVKRLTWFWAKAQKVGLDVIKEILVSYSADLTMKLLTTAF